MIGHFLPYTTYVLYTYVDVSLGSWKKGALLTINKSDIRVTAQ